MPRIIVQTNPRGGESARVTLSEQLSATKLESHHYRTQLIERLAWTIADAEELEASLPTDEHQEDAPIDRILRDPDRTPVRA